MTCGVLILLPLFFFLLSVNVTKGTITIILGDLCYFISLNAYKKKQLEDQIVGLEISLKDISSKYDESEYELEKARDKTFKQERQLEEALIKINNFQSKDVLCNTGVNLGIESINSHLAKEKNTNISEKQVYSIFNYS